MESKTTYNMPSVRLGIDDLLTEYAFHGTSQGDETRTNSVDAYKESGGWLMCVFKDVDTSNQYAINKEARRRMEANAKRICELKESGKYGAIESGGTMTLVNNPIFDKPITPEKCFPNTSCRMTILDFSK